MTSLVCLALSAAQSQAVDYFWSGGTGTYNNPTAWGGAIPGLGDQAFNEGGLGNVVQINEGDPDWTVTDLHAGGQTGGAGTYEQNGQTVTVDSWLHIGGGQNGVGVYNLNGGVLNVFNGRLFLAEAPGANGTLNINGGALYKRGDVFTVGDGGWNGGGARTATVNQNNGSVNVSAQVFIGQTAGSLSTYNLHGGFLNTSNWFVIGRGGGTGVMNMDGGTFTHVSGGQPALIVASRDGGDSVGTLNHSGGTINAIGEMWVGQGSGTLGTNNMSGNAVLNLQNWFAVGREQGVGFLNLSGGTITKTGASNQRIVIGASGGQGTVEQTGGEVISEDADIWVAEGGTGTWNLNDGSITTRKLSIGQAANSVGRVYVNGGEIIANEIGSGNIGAFSGLYLNGGTLRARASSPNFLHDLTEAVVMPGGVTIDSQEFDVTVNQGMVDGGFGGLTKIGSGSVTLAGFNSYMGPTIVSEGKLVVTPNTAGSGDYSVADGAALGLFLPYANGQFVAGNLTLGAAGGVDLDVDLGNFGNPGLAPINVIGTLAVNGTVTINLADALPQIGQFALVQYGARTGSGNFVIGSLPTGVAATVVTNVGNNSIDINITTVNLPRWNGTDGATWDLTGSQNWINIGNNMATGYGDGNRVLFDDQALGSTTVNLTATVQPGLVTFENNILPYTVTGSGKISGTTSLIKQGNATVTIENSGGNDYTGATVIGGGVLSVPTLANGGTPSPIGASSSNPTNLVLGGELQYTGPATTVNRGYAVSGTADGAINVQNSLNLSGNVIAPGTNGFVKTGAGQLGYVGTGVNVLSAPGSSGYNVTDGKVVFDGTSGSQSNLVQGSRIGVAGVNPVAPTLLLSNTIVTVQGNIDIGHVPGSRGELIVGPNTTLNVGSWFILGDGPDAAGTLTVNGGTINAPNGRFFLGGNQRTITTVNLNSGVINNGGDNFVIADGGWNGTAQRTGTVNHVSGVLNNNRELWVGQSSQGVGFYNLSGGEINQNDWVAVGRDGAQGTFIMTGGSFTKDGNGEFLIGDNPNSIGVFNHSGGTLTVRQPFLAPQDGNENSLATYSISGSAVTYASTWVAIGRGNGAGVMNMSGGLFAKVADPGAAFIIGASGPGTFNQSGGVLSNTVSPTWISEDRPATWTMTGGSAILDLLLFARNGAGVATFNFDGGIVAATEVAGGSGLADVNFNGGTLRARANTADFVHNLDSAVLLANGLTIDSDGHVIGASQAFSGTGNLTKIGSGALYLNGVNTYTGSTLVNAGALGGNGTIAGPVTVAPGATLAPGASIGTLTINNTLTLSAGSTTFVEVSMDDGPGNDQVAGLTGLTYGGSLVVSNSGSASLVAGTVYKLFDSAVAGTGNFSSVTVLPAGSASFDPATGELTITSVGAVTLNPPVFSGGNLILTGSGTPNGNYSVLTSTNLATPLSQWSTNVSGVFDGSGFMSNAIPVSTSEPSRFFQLREP